jgi:dienelactone hydrolase
MRRALLVLALVSSACKSSEKFADLPFMPASATSAPDPSKMGPYPVGVITYDSIYDLTADSVVTPPEQPQVRTNPNGGPRHLVTEVWYPATEAARGKPGKVYNVVDLMTDQEQQDVQKSGVTVPLLQTVAVENAEPRLADAPYPIVMFSHGQYGIRWQTTYFTVALASHGYIVISPDHPGDTLQDELSLESTSSGALGDSILQNYLSRQADIQFLITYFSTLPSYDQLYGMPDKSIVGVTGHSFGALTSLRLGQFDKRVKAIVPMAPTSMSLALPDAPGFGPDYHLQCPTVIEGSGDDHTLPFVCNALPAWSQLGPTAGLVEILAGGHFTFSDLCSFNLGQAASAINFIGVGNVINDGCGPTNTPSEVAKPIVNNYAIGFLNWQLRGSTGTKKYLTQDTGNALTPALPGWQQSCVTSESCSTGQACDPGPQALLSWVNDNPNQTQCPPQTPEPGGICQTVSFHSTF